MNNRKEEIKNFTLLIEKLAKSKNLTYIEAIVEYCETTGLEIEMAAKSISKNLKTKIQLEAEDLNFIKKTTDRLPI